MDFITNIAEKIQEIYKTVKPMLISSEEEQDWTTSKTCYMCQNVFTENNIKVRDHCHLTGTYLGPSCNNCNLRRVNPSFIPVIMHNLSNYDAHFIVKELGNVSGRVEVIPNSEEKYISFTKHVGKMKLRFIDSYRFMPRSLDYLVKSLSMDKFKETRKYYNDEELTLVTRKGVFPYDYIDDVEKLNETELPPIEAFYNKLCNADISVEDYTHAQNIWKHFKCQSLGDYADVYVKTDVLLLCDVFESFRNVMMNTHELDPAHYFTVPGLTFDAILKYTKMNIELLQDYDMILMIEHGIRGDANNLYGQAMSMYLPYGGFEWVNKPECINILDLREDDEIGHIFEIDISYPQEVHHIHDNLPFLPETIVPPGVNCANKLCIDQVSKNMWNFGDCSEYHRCVEWDDSPEPTVHLLRICNRHKEFKSIPRSPARESKSPDAIISLEPDPDMEASDLPEPEQHPQPRSHPQRERRPPTRYKDFVMKWRIRGRSQFLGEVCPKIHCSLKISGEETVVTLST
nr:uncharacterized protein LOC112211371 [Halyomorpha halys]